MRFLSAFLFLAALAAPALADPAPFDLAGPALRVSVTHGGVSLPIGEVPQLAEGDGIRVETDFPDDQAAHYVLVAAFLRGATNPPPDKWFFHADTWTKKGRDGLRLTVPKGAEQVALFLAPATGGDFPTLRNAVQGKPGAFVRAAQELAQAALDRARLDAYLAEVRKVVPGDPGRLERITPLLARSLQVKVNSDCLAKMPELQPACLLQNQESLVLNDGHSNALTDTVVGSGADLALQLSYTPQGGLGTFSPYIGAIRDVIGILSSIHTAKYQYFPAIGMPDGDRLRLVLNAAPSFHNPKSVLVTALPVVAPLHVPPLQLAEARPALCAADPSPLLPLSGAPLLYATRYAHGLSLRVTLPNGGTVDLPATPDLEHGGLRIDVEQRLPANIAAPLPAAVHGLWGFQPFDGPGVSLVPMRGGWRLPADANGDAATLTLAGGTAACVTGVTGRVADAAPEPLKYAADGADALTVTLPATEARHRPALTVTVSGPPGVAPERLVLSGPPAPPRFRATVIARNVERPAATAPVAVRLADDGSQVPADARLTVSLRAGEGMRFTGGETVEVAAGDGAPVTLSAGHGLKLADGQVALASFVPAERLGASAYGPLRARVVRAGVAGDWMPLGMLVRLPALHGLSCPAESGPCQLSGDDLFLLSALSPTPDFATPLLVPDGYPGTLLPVPHPAGGSLYVRLHDDPTTVARLAG